MKRLIILIAVMIAAIGAYFLLRKDLNLTAKIATKDFAIDPNLELDKIFFASNDKTKGYLTFTKDKNGIWWVENGKNKFKTDTSSLNDLLHYILPKMEVQNPVNDAALDPVNRQMALSGVKAQFYKGDRLIKTFYVGERTADDLGTYMYLPGTDRPCIVKIPGHNGYLTPFFNTDIQNWRTLSLIDIPTSDIAKVTVSWAENPTQGFTLIKNGDEPYMLDHRSQKVEANKNRMLAYLDMFTGITREAGEPAGINKTAQKDSILNSTPFFSFKVDKKDGKSEILKLYRIKVSGETYTPEADNGQLKVYEVETYWGVLQGNNEIWVMQDAILKNRMKTLSDFIR